MKKFLVSLIAVLGSLAASPAGADVPTVHGMLLFGDQATYVSHLPMFHAPHDYQLVMKVKLSAPNGNRDLFPYLQAKDAGEKMFTFVPEVMDLTQLLDGTKTAIKGSIYKGHFERGGQLLVPTAQITVEKMIVATKLNPQAEESHQYIVFGENGEYFGAHLINGKPNFDAIVAVNQPYNLKFNHCRSRVCNDPLLIPIADSLLPITIAAPNGGSTTEAPVVDASLGSFGGYATEIKNVIYYEANELAH